MLLEQRAGVKTAKREPREDKGYRRVDSTSFWMGRSQMARPRENGGSQEASPPVQPSGGHPGASSGSGSPGRFFSFTKTKGREMALNAGLAPRTQAAGGGKMETAAHQRARALLEQICADSGGRRSLRRWVFQWRQPRPLQPFRPQLARGECSKIPGLAVQGLAQLTSLLIRA